MTKLDQTLSALPDATAVAVLRRLHAEAAGQTGRLLRHYLRYLLRVFAGRPLPCNGFVPGRLPLKGGTEYSVRQ